MNFGYLSNGLPSFAANEAGVVSNVFDVANRLVGVKQCAPGGSLSYAYYPAGNVARVESVAGVSTYTNDNLERVSVIGSAVGQFTFGYNAWNGMVETITYPNGMTARYGYDEMDRATNIVFRDGQGNLVRSQALGFDAVGMITTNRLSDGNGLLEDRRYGYDGLDRLSGETVLDATGGVTRSASWNYDLAGNRLSQIADGSNTTYTCTQANRLTAWTGGSAAFDAAGCVTNLQYPDGRTLSLSWNARYQLTAVATNGGQAESYGHDALGRRVWTASAGVTNFFVYDGAQVVADVDAAGNMLRSYVWGPGIDNLLSMTTYGGTTSTYYAIKDHLGSVLALVDGTGAVAESYRYDAWGRVLEVRDAAGLLSFVGGQWSSPLGNRYLWQGREYSWPTGLYNFRARWCDPVTGRWLSNDPIGISGGLNQYVAFENNPVNFRDWSGLCPDSRYESGEDYVRGYTDALFRDWWWAWAVPTIWAGHKDRDIAVHNEFADYWYRWKVWRSDQMGNIGAGYAFSCLVGPSLSLAICTVAEGVYAIGSRSTTEDAKASIELNYRGIGYSVKDGKASFGMYIISAPSMFFMMQPGR
jgi:RHS repeat-associated protein